jgi:hypothetical protein
MHLNLDVGLSILKDLYILQQIDSFWYAMGIYGGQEIWENMKISRKF